MEIAVENDGVEEKRQDDGDVIVNQFEVQRVEGEGINFTSNEEVRQETASFGVGVPIDLRHVARLEEGQSGGDDGVDQTYDQQLIVAFADG